jgi:hypothetical protein
MLLLLLLHGISASLFSINSMEQSPSSEADSRYSGQESSRWL